MLAQTSIAAATAVLDYDLLTNNTQAKAERARILVAVGLQGSAAGGDTKIQLMVGQTEVAQIYNLTTGFPNKDAMFTLNYPIGTERIYAKVTDAPATNPINYAHETRP